MKIVYKISKRTRNSAGTSVLKTRTDHLDWPGEINLLDPAQQAIVRDKLSQKWKGKGWRVVEITVSE